MGDMMTTGDVARALGVTVNTVKAWIRGGAVQAIRLPSGHFRIPRRELERLLQGDGASQLAERRRQWAVAERWERTQPAEQPSLHATFEWVESMLRLAESHGPLVEPDIEETVEHVAELHRALAHVRR
jgi:excisionase family DNA binding protein